MPVKRYSTPTRDRSNRHRSDEQSRASPPRLRVDAPRSIGPAGPRLASALGRGHTRCTKNSPEIRGEMCGADPSGDPRGSMCFARADERKNLGPGPAHQRKNDRGDEENYKVAANTLRKIRKAPGERRPLNRVPRHETPRSNASFETKHRLLVAFQGLPSWGQIVAYET